MRKPIGIGAIDKFSTQRPEPVAHPELTLVIPVYNGSATIGSVVDQLCAVLNGLNFEIILVNDGSTDESESTCTALVDLHPERVIFLQLSRNFGEHNAVMAGIKHASGEFVAVLDDDGQNGAEDVLRLYDHAKAGSFDVVYSKYRARAHHWLRILGSRLNDRMANLLLGKPRELYLSSFKVINRRVVDEIVRYSGPFPYIDGLILRVSRNIGQLEVRHHERRAGRSGYTPAKLFNLAMSMSVGFSLKPLRAASLAGLLMVLCSTLGLVAVVGYMLFVDPRSAVGMPLLVASLLLIAGIQLIAVGIVGEYVGRIFLHQSGMPQYALRFVKHGQNLSDSASRSVGVRNA